MKPLKASIQIPYDDDDINIDIDWRVLEQVERVYGDLAEKIATETLVINPMRHKIAEVISSWLSAKGYKKRDVYQYVITSDAKTLGRYVGSIQGAILYMLRHITDEQLVTLMRGEDLDEKGESEDEKKPKKP